MSYAPLYTTVSELVEWRAGRARDEKTAEASGTIIDVVFVSLPASPLRKPAAASERVVYRGTSLIRNTPLP